jgi:geranylgeranyl reductase family protein
VVDTWDLIVVGAGPAGSAAALRALQLRPDARVALVDRAAFPRDKTCGDGLAPQVTALLAALGAAGVTDGYPEVDELIMTAPRGAVARGALPPGAHVIPREVFDARLVAEATARGATLLRHQVRRVRPVAGGVLLDDVLHARTVIGADGASSVLRRALGAARNDDAHLAVAIRGYTDADPADGVRQRMVLAAHGWPAYAWRFPTGTGPVNVGYGQILSGTRPTRSVLLDRLHDLLPGTELDPGTLRAHNLPLATQRPAQPDGRIMLAGDALSLINPLTGEGIYYALLSGALAAGSAARSGWSDGAGRAYRHALRAALGRHLRHVGLAARLTRLPGVVDAGVSAAGLDPGAFDALGELGLGRGTLRPVLLAGLARELLRRPAPA